MPCIIVIYHVYMPCLVGIFAMPLCISLFPFQTRTDINDLPSYSFLPDANISMQIGLALSENERRELYGNLEPGNELGT